jgi:hypothetical protein
LPPNRITPDAGNIGRPRAAYKTLIFQRND